MSELLDQLVHNFNEEELKSLCLDLRVNYDALPGSGSLAKARELLGYLDRKQRLEDLLTLVRKLRPSVTWLEVTAKDADVFGIEPTSNPAEPDTTIKSDGGTVVSNSSINAGRDFIGRDLIQTIQVIFAGKPLLVAALFVVIGGFAVFWLYQQWEAYQRSRPKVMEGIFNVSHCGYR
ncbi:MAG: hypothetical protein HC853_04985 [Anaerolineae bacterium]|nr:hypothetical protein [Anaerolineae bacterium]